MEDEMIVFLAIILLVIVIFLLIIPKEFFFPETFENKTNSIEDIETLVKIQQNDSSELKELYINHILPKIQYKNERRSDLLERSWKRSQNKSYFG